MIETGTVLKEISLPDTGSAQGEWLARYREFARLAYETIRRCPRRVVLAIPLLNPRHWPAPDQLELVNQLERVERLGAQSGRSLAPTLFTIVKDGFWGFAFACRESIRLLGIRISCFGRLKPMTRRPVEILIKTWGFDPASLGGPDFYFGTLADQLAQRGVSSLFLYGDGRGQIDPLFAKAAFRGGEDPGRGVPEQILIPLWAPLKTVFQQLLAAGSLRRLALQTSDAPLAQVFSAASRKSLHPATMRHSLAFYMARGAVKIWKPKAFLTLYEGQPWEQPAWHGAKAADPGCVTVGYQHTVVMPHSLRLISPHAGSWELAAPDLVLCLGEATRRMMAAGHAPIGSRLIRFGSFRRPPVGEGASSPEPSRRTVLVLPEGILQEAKLLFHFALQVARQLPDHRFIFRSHPVLPFDQVRPHLEMPEESANVEISSGRSIQADFDRSSALLYRGSSSILYGILKGLKPLYLHAAGSPDTDPLFELSGWRQRVWAADQTAQILQNYSQTDPDRAAAQWREVFDYLDGYCRPVEEESVEEFLRAVNEIRK